MPHKLCKMSARFAQPFGGHSKKTHGGVASTPPPSRMRARVKMVVLMNGHFACNVADCLLADMAAMPGKLMVHDVSLLGSWQLPAMLTVCACRRRLAPETVRMFAPRTAEFALIRVHFAVNIELPHDVFPSGQITATIVTAGIWRANLFLVNLMTGLKRPSSRPER